MRARKLILWLILCMPLLLPVAMAFDYVGGFAAMSQAAFHFAGESVTPCSTPIVITIADGVNTWWFLACVALFGLSMLPAAVFLLFDTALSPLVRVAIFFALVLFSGVAALVYCAVRLWQLHAATDHTAIPTVVSR